MDDHITQKAYNLLSKYQVMKKDLDHGVLDLVAIDVAP
jgi:hypothetical protein